MFEKKIIVISDPHLGVQSHDVENMIDFIEKLDPQKHEILFLGDLFHIWAGPAKYHISPVSEKKQFIHPGIKGMNEVNHHPHISFYNSQMRIRDHNVSSICCHPRLYSGKLGT